MCVISHKKSEICKISKTMAGFTRGYKMELLKGIHIFILVAVGTAFIFEEL